MLEKILGILGFNKDNSYIGLHRLNETQSEIQEPIKSAKSELKLSDLMRKN